MGPVSSLHSLSTSILQCLNACSERQSRDSPARPLEKSVLLSSEKNTVFIQDRLLGNQQRCLISTPIIYSHPYQCVKYGQINTSISYVSIFTNGNHDHVSFGMICCPIIQYLAQHFRNNARGHELYSVLRLVLTVNTKIELRNDGYSEQK